jgi:hypothetical protein
MPRFKSKPIFNYRRYKMRITVEQLKELIKESIEEMLQEKKVNKGSSEKMRKLAAVAHPEDELDAEDFKELGRRSKAKAKSKEKTEKKKN